MTTIIVSPAAWKEMEEFIKNEPNLPETAGVRISVMPGGCSGFKYDISIVDTCEDDDEVVDYGTVKIFIDPFSSPYLNNVEVDYTDSMMGSGFKFMNPNASNSCGCNKSFAV